MTTLRKFFYSLAVFFAFVTLMQLPYAFAVSSVLGNPHNIDTALKEGGAYDNFAAIVLDESAKNTQDADAKKLLADQGVRNAVTSSVQANDIQAASQSVIGGFYAWLQGKTSQPEFTIDLSKPAEQATTKLATYAQERAANLPTCTLQQLQTINVNDPLSLPCLPPGVSAAQVGQEFAEQAKQQVDFLQNPVVSSSKLREQGDAKDIENSQLPKVYQSLQDSKWFTLGLAAVLITLLIFARRNRLAGLRIVGIVLLVCAGLLGLAVLLFSLGRGNVTTDTKLAEVMANTVLNIVGQLSQVIRWFALGYAAVGILALVAIRRLTPPTQPTEIPTTPTNPVVAP